MNIKCKSCDHVFFVIDEMVEQNVECPNCHEKVLIKAQMSEENNTPNSKRCPNCGLEVLPEALFCTNCGAKLFQDNNDKKDMGENKNLEEKCSDLKKKIHTKKNRLLVILCIIFTLILIPIVTSLYKSYQHHRYQKRQQTKIQELYKRQQTKIQELLNLEGLDVDIAQRIIDFTSGSTYAISGNLQKISRYIFIITPASVDISGDFQSMLNGAFGGGVSDGPQQIN